MQTPSSSKTYPIAIVGAGLIGRLLAWQLAEQGFNITVFDKADPLGQGSAAYAAGGMLAPYAELALAHSEIFTLGQESLALWPDITSKLAARGHEVYFKQRGSLYVASQQDLSELQLYQQRAEVILNKTTGSHGMTVLPYEELIKLEDELDPSFQHGIFLADDAHLSAKELLSALYQDCLQLGVNWQQQEIISLENKIVATTESKQVFELVIDCRGIGAQADLPNLRGVRGERVIVHAPEVEFSRPVRLLHPRYPIYVVPLRDKHYLIGATEFNCEDNSPVSTQTCLELLSMAYRLHKGFAESRIIELQTAVRAAFPDNLPLIAYDENLWRVNGLYRHGYLLAPALAKQIGDNVHAYQG